jgi:hypothetical protein
MRPHRTHTKLLNASPSDDERDRREQPDRGQVGQMQEPCCNGFVIPPPTPQSPTDQYNEIERESVVGLLLPRALATTDLRASVGEWQLPRVLRARTSRSVLPILQQDAGMVWASDVSFSDSAYVVPSVERCA